MTPLPGAVQGGTAVSESRAPAAPQSYPYSRRASLTLDPGEGIIKQLGDLTLSSMKLISPLKDLAESNPAIKKVIESLGETSSEEGGDANANPSEKTLTLQDLGALIELRGIHKQLDELSNFSSYLPEKDCSKKPPHYQHAKNALDKAAKRESGLLDLKTELTHLLDWMETRLEAYSKKLGPSSSQSKCIGLDVCCSRVADGILKGKQEGWEDRGPSSSSYPLFLTPKYEELEGPQLLASLCSSVETSKVQEITRRLERAKSGPFRSIFLENPTAIRIFLCEATADWASYYFESLLVNKWPPDQRDHFRDLLTWNDWSKEENQQLLLKICEAMLIACERHAPSISAPFCSMFFEEFASVDFMQVVPKLKASQLYTMIASSDAPCFSDFAPTNRSRSLKHQFRVLELNALIRHLPHDRSEPAFQQLEVFLKRPDLKHSGLAQKFGDERVQELGQLLTHAATLIAHSEFSSFESRSELLRQMFDSLAYMDHRTRPPFERHLQLLKSLSGEAFCVVFSAFDDSACNVAITKWSKQASCVPVLETLLEASIDERISYDRRCGLGRFIFQNFTDVNLTHWKEFFSRFSVDEIEEFANNLFDISKEKCEILRNSGKRNGVAELSLHVAGYQRFTSKILPFLGKDTSKILTRLNQLPIARYSLHEGMKTCEEIVDAVNKRKELRHLSFR